METNSDSDNPKIVKKSISLSEVLFKWADQYWKKEGYNGFSAFVAALIMQDKKRVEGGEPDSGKSSNSRYQLKQPQLNEVHEKPAAAQPPAKKKRAA